MTKYESRLERLEATLLHRGPILIHVPDGTTLDERMAALGIRRDPRVVYLGLDEDDVRA